MMRGVLAVLVLALPGAAFGQLVPVASLTFADGARVTVTQLLPAPGSDSLCLPARVRVCQITPRVDTARRFAVLVVQGDKPVAWSVRAGELRKAAIFLDGFRTRRDTLGPAPFDDVRASLRCDSLACSASISSPTRWKSSFPFLKPGPLPKNVLSALAAALWSAGAGAPFVWSETP